jgi:hypothetical protein
VKSKYSFYTVLFLLVFGIGVFQFVGVDKASTRRVALTGNQVLGKLTSAEEDSERAYSRSYFKHWVDADGDCLDTRQEVLKRDSSIATQGSCSITSGSWVSWVDGKKFTNPRLMDIDHLVPLAEAWDSGASSWTSTQRRAYANDLGYKWSLQAITLSVNRSKSDSDIAEWLPQQSVQCVYVQRWMAVKYRWRLTVDSAERSAIKEVLTGSCGAKSMVLPSRFPSVPNQSQSNQSPVTTKAPVQKVYPGAYCSTRGATGVASNGYTYTCKTSSTDDRLRWRR